jgi:hypothetical protein
MAGGPLRPPLAPAKRRCRSTPVPLPPELQSRLRRFAAELIEHHGDVFKNDSEIKSRVAAMLRRYLPPWPRRGGRPGFVSVTLAIRLHGEIKWAHPEWSNKKIWDEVYRRSIPRWEVLSTIERRTEADWLHSRVRWRLCARRRKHRKIATGKPTI